MNANQWAALTGGPVSTVAGIDMVGAMGSATSIDINTLDQKVRQLSADVQAQATDPTLMMQWIEFATRWEAWHLLNVSASGPLDATTSSQLETFVSEYNDKLGILQRAGIKTDAGRDTTFDGALLKAWETVTDKIGTVGAVAVGAATIYLAYEAWRSATKR